MNEENLITPSASQAREFGRRGGIASGMARRRKAQRVADIIAAFGVEPITRELVKKSACLLLAMNEENLRGVARNEKMPVYMRTQASLLLSSDEETAFNVSERLLDRAFGKPRQYIDPELPQPPLIQVLDLGIE
ncbi:MAG: hypothetical protein IJ650_05365 [Paludibacteraceae bacterium]|nr:hypothetical protein [Paludibacteraceae bacterium]